MSTIVLSLLILSGCSYNQTFIKKANVSDAQFFQDKVYCQSGASGQNQEATKDQRLIPYAECMLNLGYQQK
ncbi:MAG: hypothetical protein JXK16_05090 [Thiotrichales bacterium]|nr:hypothetical protein [Thiotrichales bacterium]